MSDEVGVFRRVYYFYVFILSYPILSFSSLFRFLKKKQFPSLPRVRLIGRYVQ